MMKKSVLSRTISFVLTLFLAGALLVCGACIYAEKTVADPRNVDLALDQGDYAEKLREEILAKWENLLSICGIQDPAPMLSVVTVQRVSEDAHRYFTGVYEGQQMIDLDSLKSALEEKLWDYVDTLEEADPEELKGNIDELTEACMEEYRVSVRVPLLHTFLGKLTARRAWLTAGAVAAAVFAAVLTVFLFFLQPSRRDTLYFFAIAGLTDTVLTVGLWLFARQIRLVERLPLAPSALRDLAVYCAQDMMDKLLLWGLACTGVTALCLIVFLLIPKKR